MTISLKKVTAGSGYTYLTEQVAAQDGQVRTGLAAYYEEKGEAPGVWMGTGMDGFGGLNAGDPVTADSTIQVMYRSWTYADGKLFQDAWTPQAGMMRCRTCLSKPSSSRPSAWGLCSSGP